MTTIKDVHKLNIKKSYSQTLQTPIQHEQHEDISCENQKLYEESRNMLLPHFWTIWIHDNSSKDWTTSGYNKLMKIETLCDFWEFINNFNNFNYMGYQFCIMKENIMPFWEDPCNCNGGAATIRISTSNPKLLNIWEELCVLIISESFCNIPDEINGISFNLKWNMVVIKIWNKNSKVNICKFIPDEFIEKNKLFNFIDYLENRTGMK